MCLQGHWCKWNHLHQVLLNIWLSIALPLCISQCVFAFLFFFLFFVCMFLGFFQSQGWGSNTTWPGTGLEQLWLILECRLAGSPKEHLHIQNFIHTHFVYMGGEGKERKVNSEYMPLNSKLEFCSQEGKMAERHFAVFEEGASTNSRPQLSRGFWGKLGISNNR